MSSTKNIICPEPAKNDNQVLLAETASKDPPAKISKQKVIKATKVKNKNVILNYHCLNQLDDLFGNNANAFINVLKMRPN